MVTDGINISEDWIGFTSDFSFALRIGMALALGEQLGLIDRHVSTDSIDDEKKRIATQHSSKLHRGYRQIMHCSCFRLTSFVVVAFVATSFTLYETWLQTSHQWSKRKSSPVNCMQCALYRSETASNQQRTVFVSIRFVLSTKRVRTKASMVQKRF